VTAVRFKVYQLRETIRRRAQYPPKPLVFREVDLLFGPVLDAIYWTLAAQLDPEPPVPWLA
jgi:hypothetical protein